MLCIVAMLTASVSFSTDGTTAKADPGGISVEMQSILPISIVSNSIEAPVETYIFSMHSDPFPDIVAEKPEYISVLHPPGFTLRNSWHIENSLTTYLSNFIQKCQGFIFYNLSRC